MATGLMLWWLCACAAAVCVTGLLFAVRCVWIVAKIGNTRIRTNRLIEISRLRDIEIGDIVDALYQKEMVRKCL